MGSRGWFIDTSSSIRRIILPSSSTLPLRHRIVASHNTSLQSNRPPIRTVFQSFSLIPHWELLQAYGTWRRGLDGKLKDWGRVSQFTVMTNVRVEFPIRLH